MKGKLKLIETHRSHILHMNETARSYMDQEIALSENCRNTKGKDEERGMYMRTLCHAEERLQHILKDNIGKELIIRTEKLNSQLHLKEWLEKYDNEVGSRTSTVRELNKILENEQEHLNKLEETCSVQAAEEYTFLMDQKEREEKALQEEKMLLFMMNRSARIIQRNFRLVLAKRRLKKGKRGKGKGKKSA